MKSVTTLTEVPQNMRTFPLTTPVVHDVEPMALARGGSCSFSCTVRLHLDIAEGLWAGEGSVTLGGVAGGRRREGSLNPNNYCSGVASIQPIGFRQASIRLVFLSVCPLVDLSHPVALSGLGCRPLADPWIV